MTKNIKLYCNVCNQFVGERTELVMKLKKGTRIEIICTCLECSKPNFDVPDILMGFFK